MTVGWTVTGSV